MVHFSRLLHTWLRPHFLDSAFLQRAWGRCAGIMDWGCAGAARVAVPTAKSERVPTYS